MLAGTTAIRRAACLPFFKVPKTLARAFKPPWKKTTADENACEGNAPRKRRTLGICRLRMKPIKSKNLRFVRPKSVGSKCTSEDSVVTSGELLLMDIANFRKSKAEDREAPIEPEVETDDLETRGPKEWDPLVLWEGDVNGDKAIVQVEPILCKWLRPHQREGVQFLVECVCGLRDYEGNGCILADDMGLGKTLQAITLIYTLLRQMPFGQSPLQRVIVVCPTSLIGNWGDEFRKWLGKRVRTAPLSEGGNHALKMIRKFLRDDDIDVLIISYETFRMYVELFAADPDKVDLLVCDEAHRLKNNETLTSKALNVLSCRRRVLLSGTPMQNKLDEFYAMVDFTNPGILGKIEAFRRRYERPIEYGREPGCTEKEEALGNARAAELQQIVDEFIVRRTNDLLSKHLPDKVVQVVCVGMTPIQRKLYEHILSAKLAHFTATGKHTGALQTVNTLKKICNHPMLVFQDARKAMHERSGSCAHGLIDCLDMMPSAYSSGRGGRASSNAFNATHSGKFDLMERMLIKLRRETDDRIVIVSNYTQTLDLFVQLCSKHRFPYIKLDGSTSVKKRTALVHKFNDLDRDEFVFLLSSKAGGCGLNLVGGNRLVLFDPDWNPATDKQAAARVWRDGQKKRVFIYRLLATGTIEEKIFQRQISKEGLQNAVVEKSYEANILSSTDLRDIFSIDSNSKSNTHDKLKCTRCRAKRQSSKSQRDADRCITTPSSSVGTDDVSECSEVSSVVLDVDSLKVGTPVSLLYNDTRWDATVRRVTPARIYLEYSDGSEERVTRDDLAARSLRAPSMELTASTIIQASGSSASFGDMMDGDESTLDLKYSATLNDDDETTVLSCTQAVGDISETDVMNWAHHAELNQLQDGVLRDVGKRLVTFVFELEVLSSKDTSKEASTGQAGKGEKRKQKENGVTTKAAPAKREKSVSTDTVLCPLHGNTDCGLCAYEVTSK
eukprot:g902.t1